MSSTEYIHSKQHEAETAVLGAVLIEPPLYAEAAGIVAADDFTLPFHKAIFGKMGELFGKAETFDMVMLLENLIRANDDERINAKEYIMRLVDSVPIIGNLKYYCGYVKERAIGRKAMDIIRNADFGGLTDADISETVQGTAEKLSELVRDKSRGKIQAIMDVLLEIQQDVFAESENTSISTGFWTLDKLLDGIEPGDLVTVGAGTGVGKTAFMLQIISNMAKSGKKIMLYSQEMTAKQNIQRIVSRISGVELKKLKRHDRTSEDEKEKVLKAFEIIHKYMVSISAEGGLRVSDISLDCVKNKDIDVIFVDHVGLMRGEGTHQKRDDELTQIMTGLRALALRLKKPIIALAQLNREAKPEILKKGSAVREIEPQLHHFKGSSEIEQSSGTVIFLWRMADYDKTGMIGVKVAKNRQGENGRLYMRFDAPTMNFREVLDYNPPPGFTAAGENDLEEMLFS